MTESLQISELVRLAESVLEVVTDPDALISRMEEYSEALAAWMATAEGGVGDETEAELRSLVALHGAILDRVGAMQSELGVERRELRTKGKGVMRYIDILPRRISRRTEKKG